MKNFLHAFLCVLCEKLLKWRYNVGLVCETSSRNVLPSKQMTGFRQSLLLEGKENLILVRSFHIWYLWTTAANHNSIHEQVKGRLNSRNAVYHSVQNHLHSLLLSKNVKIKIHKTIILPVVLYGCETWSLTLREEHRLRVGVGIA
jgi:hypothetical protein